MRVPRLPSESSRDRPIAAGLAAFGLLIAVCGFGAYSYWLGNVSGHHKAQAQRYIAEYNERTERRIVGCFSDVAAPRECVENAIADNHEQQRAERELQAQREMADWAFWMLIVAIASFIVTSIGTVIIALQVKLTTKAVEETALATNAMNTANKIAADGQRAWIIIEPELRYLRVTAAGIVGLSCVVRFRNHGKTVARDVSIIGGVLAVHNHDCESAIDRISPLAKDLALGSRAIIPTESLDLRLAQFGGSHNATPKISQYILIWARANYRVEGKEEICQTMRFFIAGRAAPKSVLPAAITDADANSIDLLDVEVVQAGEPVTT